MAEKRSDNYKRCVCHAIIAPSNEFNSGNTATIATATFTYDKVDRCDVIMTSIKDYLILQCAFNTIAAGVSIWFVVLLWNAKSRRKLSSDYFARWRSASVAAAAIALDPTLALRYAMKQSVCRMENARLHAPNSVCCSPLLQHKCRGLQQPSSLQLEQLGHWRERSHSDSGNSKSSIGIASLVSDTRI